MSTNTSTDPSNGKATTTAPCESRSGKAAAYGPTIKLFILFLLGFCGMIAAFWLGRSCSPQIRQLLLGTMNGPEIIVDSSSSAADAPATEGANFTMQCALPPSHRSSKVSSLNDDVGDVATNDDQPNTCANGQWTTTAKNVASRKRFHELLVHPLLLNIQPPPQSVILPLWTNKQTGVLAATMLDEIQREIASLLDEIVKHKSMKGIYIAAGDPITLQGCHAVVSTFHFKSHISLRCTSIDRLAKKPTMADAVILPSWPKTNNDFEDEDEDEDDDEEEEDDYGLESRIMPWFHRLSSHGALATILGTTFSLNHIVAGKGMVNERWNVLEYLNASYPRIIDYDIPASYYFYDDSSSSSRRQRCQVRSNFPINVAVAFKSLDGMAYWRMNEAHYNMAMNEHLTEDSLDDLLVFDSAAMLQLQYPPSHSSWYYCGGYKNSNDCDFHGYDPEYPNIPLTDLYVSKSKAGDNAGRGVFTKVDIPASSNIALEATTQSIHYEWKTTELHRNMVEEVEQYAQDKGKIVFLYAEAYGYASNP
jgi:hypothetical protein